MRVLILVSANVHIIGFAVQCKVLTPLDTKMFNDAVGN